MLTVNEGTIVTFSFSSSRLSTRHGKISTRIHQGHERPANREQRHGEHREEMHDDEVVEHQSANKN